MLCAELWSAFPDFVSVGVSLGVTFLIIVLGTRRATCWGGPFVVAVV
jgi:hypothetical protein